MRVLITGASGFVGSHVAERFVRDGHQVRAIVRATSNTKFLRSIKVDLHQASLQDHAAMRGVDVVVHVAAKVEAYGRWSEFQETTVNGTGNVLASAVRAGVSHFIYISSVGVYPWPPPGGANYDETSPYGQPYRWSYYARAKIAAEHLVREAKIATTILRPSWIYGPRDFTIFVRLVEALRSHRVRWIGAGDNRLNLIYATDVAEAVRLAATKSQSHGQIYNVAADETSPTQREFLTRICELLALPVPTSSLPIDRAHRLGFLSECVAHATGFRVTPPFSRLSAMLLGGRRLFSNQKLKTELGWQPHVGFAEGSRATAEWFTSLSRAPETVRASGHTDAP